MLNKRLGQIATGKQAWLKLVKKGKLHGRVNHMGAVTSRCTHSNPNLAQVPRVSAEYGKECREFFLYLMGTLFLGLMRVVWNCVVFPIFCIVMMMENIQKNYLKVTSILRTRKQQGWKQEIKPRPSSMDFCMEQEKRKLDQSLVEVLRKEGL